MLQPCSVFSVHTVEVSKGFKRFREVSFKRFLCPQNAKTNTPPHTSKDTHQTVTHFKRISNTLQKHFKHTLNTSNTAQTHLRTVHTERTSNAFQTHLKPRLKHTLNTPQTRLRTVQTHLKRTLNAFRTPQTHTLRTLQKDTSNTHLKRTPKAFCAHRMQKQTPLRTPQKTHIKR